MQRCEVIWLLFALLSLRCGMGVGVSVGVRDSVGVDLGVCVGRLVKVWVCGCGCGG